MDRGSVAVRRLGVLFGLGLAVSLPRSARAHGDQVLLLIGPWLLLILGGMVFVLAWRAPWRLKISLYAALLVAIAATMFLPLVSDSVADLAGDEPASIVAYAGGLPVALTVGAYFLLRRAFGGRPRDGA